MLGNKLDINGYSIHYEKIGFGNEYLLFLPGGIGKL